MTGPNILLGIALSTIFLYAPDASAQLFGQRSVGQPLNRQATAARNATGRSPPTGRAASNAAANRLTTESGAGVVNENARFIRGNRDVSDFVGAANPEAEGFVGRLEAGVDAAEIRSAVDELLIETGADANQVALPVMPPRVLIYAPRLKVAYDFSPTTDIEVNTRLMRQLEASLPVDSSNRIEVLVAGDAAILRGAVASERDRKLAQLLLQFEPGIARVENQLQVQPGELPKPVPRAQEKASSPD